MTCVLWSVYLLQAFWTSTLADVIHTCQGAVLFLLCENMCFGFLLFLLGVSLLNVFLSKRARSLWERALNVRGAQHAYKVSRKHFKTGGSCNIPVQGILINRCAKVFHGRALTGRCGDIRKMTAMLGWWFNMKNMRCFVAISRVIPNNATKESHY